MIVKFKDTPPLSKKWIEKALEEEPIIITINKKVMEKMGGDGIVKQ